MSITHENKDAALAAGSMVAAVTARAVLRHRYGSRPPLVPARVRWPLAMALGALNASASREARRAEYERGRVEALEVTPARVMRTAQHLAARDGVQWDNLDAAEQRKRIGQARVIIRTAAGAVRASDMDPAAVAAAREAEGVQA